MSEGECAETISDSWHHMMSCIIASMYNICACHQFQRILKRHSYAPRNNNDAKPRLMSQQLSRLVSESIFILDLTKRHLLYQKAANP